MKYTYSFILLLVTLLGVSQPKVINRYAEVRNVLNGDKDDPDTVVINSASNFLEGDTVLLIQMKGASIDNNGLLKKRGYAGRHEFLLINEIKGDSVVFTTSLTKATEGIDKLSYSPSDALQLVKVPFFRSTTLEGDYTCDDWNGKTGGVFAIVVSDSLTIKGTINVSHKGFKGGNKTISANIKCSKADPAGYNLKYFRLQAIDSAGVKGEGIVSRDSGSVFYRGSGSLLNGGGGGSGLYGGGAGGSAFGSGGTGDFESEICGSYKPANRSEGGRGIYQNFIFPDIDTVPRAFLGGGGGSGTSNDSLNPTNGGNGGGIIFIIAEKLFHQNGKLIANGQSIDTMATGAGGGGGGAGSIFLDVNTYFGIPEISATGGNGGSVDNPDFPGCGGGGGGGILWVSDDTPINFLKNGGSPGNYTSPRPSKGAISGNIGGQKFFLKSPLYGFLFNYLPSKQDICEGDTPREIIGSQPKGGNGKYTYEWLYSENKINWTTLSTAKTKNYKPNPLAKDAYFKRIVYSTDQNDTSKRFIDTSNVHLIKVFDAVTNNTIGIAQTICQQQNADTLSGSIPYGGIGNYSLDFEWQQKKGTQNWMDADYEYNKAYYSPEKLLNPIYYRRVARKGPKGFCSDTSNIILINVIPKIYNNTIFQDTTICKGNIVDSINGSIPTGGTGIHSFKWELFNGNNWIFISNKTNTYIGKIDTESALRRIVNSSVCSDTSKSKIIKVLDVISNNILQDDSTICYASTPKIYASLPLGGDQQYKYNWLFSNNVNFFDTAIGTQETTNFISDTVKSNITLKRIVFSGPYNCCSDTSSATNISIFPITKLTLAKDSLTLCENESFIASVITEGMLPLQIKINQSDSYSIYDTPFNINITSNDSIYKITEAKDGYNCPVQNIEGVILVNRLLSPYVSIPSDTSACGNSIELIIKSNNGTLSWNLPNVWYITSDSNERIKIETNEFGKNKGKVTINNGRCPKEIEFSIHFFEQPKPLDINKTYQLSYTTSHQLIIPSQSPAVINWKSENPNIQITTENTLISLANLEHFENRIIYTISNGSCQEISDTIILFVQELFVPEGFSPNSDNVNDVFEIKGITEFKNPKLIVFNNQGKEVYRSFNYDNTWNGTHNGNPLPEGNYFYSLEIEGKLYKGNVILKRH